MFGSAYGGASQRPPKAPIDLIIRCECTLEELYLGCMKRLTYEREVLGLDEKSTKKKSDNMEFEIKPGYSEGTVLRFPGRGNEACCYPTCIKRRFSKYS